MIDKSIDETEILRQVVCSIINAEPGSRAALETEHGRVWDTAEMSADFEVKGFLAPFVAVKRKSDGVSGSLVFQHRPRFYFDFSKDDG